MHSGDGIGNAGRFLARLCHIGEWRTAAVEIVVQTPDGIEALNLCEFATKMARSSWVWRYSVFSSDENGEEAEPYGGVENIECTAMFTVFWKKFMH